MKKLYLSILSVFVLLAVGCVKKAERIDRPMFQKRQLDSCLVIGVDLSKSFAADFGDRAYPLLIEVMDKYFSASMGKDSKIVLVQISGNADAVLFEGTPRELRSRFSSPEELAEFFQKNSSPNSSPIYEATGKTLTYINAMADVTCETRSLVCFISDLKDSEQDAKLKSKKGFKMLDALKEYQGTGGSIAFYYVEQEEVKRWEKILAMAGFEPERYSINNDLVESPELPVFE